MHLIYLSGEVVRVCAPRMKKCFEFVSQLSHLHNSPSALSYLIRFIFSHALGGVWCTIPLVSFRISTIEEIAAWVDVLSVLGSGRKSVVMLNLRSPAASFHYPLRSSLILTQIISAMGLLVFLATS